MSKKRRVLVTAALPYSNGRPHVGHLAGCYLGADIYVRYLRMTGAEVRFVSGSDDHGVAIMITGDKEGKTPSEVADFYNAKQRTAFKALGIDFDIYSSTSRCPYHTKTSQDFFLRVHEKGFLEKVESEQLYDPSKNMFLPDRYVKGTCGYCNTPEQYGDQCEQCGQTLDTETLKDPRSTLTNQPAIKKKTMHWYIDLSRFESDVADWLENATLRDQTKSYVRGLLSTGLVRRSMTRDISWGIPVPLDDPDAIGKVLYVWFDAPIGYISNTKELCVNRGENAEQHRDWWASEDTEVYHFIGEDNAIFHCVIWIAMLKAEGSYKLPNGVIVNQYLNIQFPGKDVEKISKSRGNAPWLEDFVAAGGNPDSMRFYLTMIAPEKARTAYRPEDLVQRHNSELANVLGNFINRILTFTRKNVAQSAPAYDPNAGDERDREFSAAIVKCVDETSTLLNEFSFKTALEGVMEFARECNRYVDERAPWKTRKDDMPRTITTITHALWAIKALGIMLSPFMPISAGKILSMISIQQKDALFDDAKAPVKQGAVLIEPEILFTKIEDGFLSE
jgi:methionyl-tRNA synthetase